MLDMIRSMRFKLSLIFVLAACAGALCAAGIGSPVWVKGAEKEMNAFYGFSATFDAKKGERPTLRLSAGAIARV